MVKCTNKRLASLIPFTLTGFIIVAIIFITIVTIVGSISKQALLETIENPYITYIIKSNLEQAFISSFLSVVLAIPIARALHRRSKFFGRKLIINFINLSFALPVIALILGIIVIHGKNGWLNSSMNFIFGVSFQHYLYGIFGVALAHVSFCLPLAVRAFLNCLESTSSQTWRLSSQLNLSSWNLFKIIEWPSIRQAFLSVFILIFLMCFVSFVIVLSLGGGPSVTTLEVSIYHAIKIDFNLSQAAVLSFIQFTICMLLMLIAQKFNKQIFAYTSTSQRLSIRSDGNSVLAKLIDGLFLFILSVISILPTIVVIKNGFNAKLIEILHSSRFFFCLKQSLLISMLSSIIALVMSLSLISGAFYFHHHLLKPKLAEKIIFLSNIKMVIPMYVFITGLFLTLQNFTVIIDHAFFILAVINALAALPFVVNILWSDSINFTKEEINLCKQLNINYWNFIKVIYFPRIKRNLGYALSFAMAISWGDIGAMAFFNSKDLNTLPHLLYAMLSSYRIEEAISVALIIMLLSLFFFWIGDELWSENQNART
jgi:thiamine transport system permease protein